MIIFPSIFPVRYLALLHMAERSRSDIVKTSILPSKKLGKTMPGGHSYPFFQNYWRGLNFQGDLRKRSGPEFFSSVFLNSSSKHPDITSRWPRMSMHPLRSKRSPADHLLHWGVRGWGGPIPHCRDCSVSEKLQVQKRGGKK